MLFGVVWRLYNVPLITFDAFPIWSKECLYELGRCRLASFMGAAEMVSIFLRPSKSRSWD